MDELSKSSEEPVLKPEEKEPVGELAPESEAEDVVKLSEPSKELAIRLLGEISFQERLTGTTMHAVAGNRSVSIYSFKQAVDFLHVDVVDFMVRGSGSIGYINPDKLEKWVGEVFGDKELAEAIGEKIKEGNNYKERMLPIKELMEQRLKQCKEVIGEVTEA